PGTLSPLNGGHRTALSWAEGLPAVTAEVRAPMVEPFSSRFVLDSGTDHVTLFGRAAARIMAEDSPGLVFVPGFGLRSVPTAKIMLNLDGHPRRVLAVLMRDVKDRQEDGLVPTSFFRSVFVSSAEGVVIFDASPSLTNAEERTTACEATAPPR